MKNGKISGSIANTTFYESEGAELLRSKPGRGRVRQASTSKVCASRFGRASSMTHPLLNALVLELNFKIKKTNRGRVVGAVSNWLTSLNESAVSALSSFHAPLELNELISLEKTMKISLETALSEDNFISVSVGAFVPETAIKAPRLTTRVELKFVLVTQAKTLYRKELAKYPVSIEVPYNDKEVPAQIISFPVNLMKNTNFLVGLTITFSGFGLRGTGKECKWLPAGVLCVGKIDAV